MLEEANSAVTSKSTSDPSTGSPTQQTKESSQHQTMDRNEDRDGHDDEDKSEETDDLNESGSYQLCHHPRKNSSKGIEKSLSERAQEAHLSHHPLDTSGSCS